MNQASCALCDWATHPDFDGNPDLELNNHIRYEHASNIHQWYPLAAAAARLGLDGTVHEPHPHDLEGEKLNDISHLVDEWAADAQAQPPAAKARILRRVAKVRGILGRVRLR